MSHHEVFDIGYWNSELKTAVDRLESVVSCDSPIEIVNVEHYRQLASAMGDLGPSVPVDRFAFGCGEPKERFVTKVNGLPYRPIDTPWPTDSGGSPMAFLMQLCFADSTECIGALPGDVLLVFVAQTEGLAGIVGPSFNPYNADALKFEWYRLGLHDLATQSTVVPPRFEFPTCYGVRHRSCDYSSEQAQRLLAQVDPLNVPSTTEPRPVGGNYPFMRHGGTKIGGVPLWSRQLAFEPPGRFLGCFTGVSCSTALYPWTNQRKPLSDREGLSDRNFLSVGSGTILFYLRDDGSVDWYRTDFEDDYSFS